MSILLILALSLNLILILSYQVVGTVLLNVCVLILYTITLCSLLNQIDSELDSFCCCCCCVSSSSPQFQINSIFGWILIVAAQNNSQQFSSIPKTHRILVVGGSKRSNLVALSFGMDAAACLLQNS